MCVCSFPQPWCLSSRLPESQFNPNDSRLQALLTEPQWTSDLLLLVVEANAELRLSNWWQFVKSRKAIQYLCADIINLSHFIWSHCYSRLPLFSCLLPVMLQFYTNLTNAYVFQQTNSLSQLPSSKHWSTDYLFGCFPSHIKARDQMCCLMSGTAAVSMHFNTICMFVLGRVPENVKINT